MTDRHGSPRFQADHPPTSVDDSRPQVPADRRRVVVERLQPAIDEGRFPIKRTVGETVVVTADVFADGPDLIAGVLKYRHTDMRRGGPSASAEAAADRRSAKREGWSGPPEGDWTEVPLSAGDNDSWSASFVVNELGEYEYTVDAWMDRFGTWLKELIAKAGAQQDVASELLEGAELVQHAASEMPVARTLSGSRGEPKDGAPAAPARPGVVARPTTGRPDESLRLLEVADLLRSDRPQAERVAAARDPGLRALMQARPDRRTATVYDPPLRVTVDPVRARFGAWYEMFPRSCTPDPSRSGTFREAEARLPAIAGMGFDVLYLPPVHPIGRTHRKGRNNSLTPAAGDPGSPWAIGSEDGGHTAIERGLGTIDDFDRFVEVARRLGLEIALDIAFQASPDHPWVREHPEWFRHRPDGSIKYAENPPKKYQDIYPLNFDSDAAASLWAAARDVFLFWIAHGVKIFRVDNPHTKPFRFWEWLIADIRRTHPDTIFLAEAFTRPKVMRYLAKAGFSQSYTYFTWRNTARELREYLVELTTTDVREYMRPNFFANTPDILHEYLQTGGRAAFEVRLILAATLAASYGIYSGFELCENVPVRPGSEEYRNSEKYEIRPRDWNQAGNLSELIAQVNQIRRDYPPLQRNDTLAFHATDNDALLWFSKGLEVFVVANTDPHRMQHGWIEMPIHDLGIAPDRPYVVEDLLDGARYMWRGAWNYVKLDPRERVAHIFVVRS